MPSQECLLVVYGSRWIYIYIIHYNSTVDTCQVKTQSSYLLWQSIPLPEDFNNFDRHHNTSSRVWQFWYGQKDFNVLISGFQCLYMAWIGDLTAQQQFSSKMCYIWCPRRKWFHDTFISAQTSMFTFYKPHTVKLCTGSEGFFCTVIAAIFSAGTTKCIRSHLCGLVFVLSKLPTNNGPSISHCLSL